MESQVKNPVTAVKMSTLEPRKRENLEPDQILVRLANGTRKPVNAYERKLLAEIKEIERKGHILEIPHDFF